jgi:hypothetical protein
MNRALELVSVALSFTALALAGCSPIVGAECRAALAQCGGECVDLDRDPRHCGACDNACAGGQACVLGACALAPDDTLGDAGIGFALGDDASIATESDAGDLPPADAGIVGSDAGEPESCDLGELRCGDSCVRPDSDPLHCGGCGMACADGEVCSAGACADVCSAPRMICDERCVDPRTDPDHCGACGERCESGVCALGECIGPVAGHVVLVGHDYVESRSGMNRIAGNAVFLGRGAPVRVLAYEGDAEPDAIAGTDAAIDQVAASIGRTWTRSGTSDASEVPVLLADADVLVVYAQANATDETLERLGKDWRRALGTFLRPGGVLVVFDGSRDNGATLGILVRAGLIAPSQRTDVSGTVIAITAPADAVALDVPLHYRAERTSIRYDDLDDGIVSAGSAPVVVHRTYVP